MSVFLEARCFCATFLGGGKTELNNTQIYTEAETNKTTENMVWI